MKENWDLEANLALQISLAVNGEDKPTRYVVMVSVFKARSLTLYKLVSADVAMRSIIILLLLAKTQTVHRSFRSHFLKYFRFPNDKGVDKLDERVLPDFDQNPMIEFIESRN